MRVGRWVLAVWLAVIFVLNSCSERKEKPTAFRFKVHPPQWMQELAADFHAKKVATLGIKYCADCHGADYKGGKSAVSCYTCHGGGPSGHPEGWLSPAAEKFHGKQVKLEGWDSCAACHGSDYKGGTSGKSCFLCHNGPGGHPFAWMNPQAADFHGSAVAQNGPTPCQLCHGSDYRGGRSGKSCYICHNGPGGHPSGWLDTQSPDFHGVKLRTSGWDLARCQVCHGVDYDGGTSGASCLSCHPATPEACNTCHGSSQNPAPPKDTEGHTATTFKGVGAHQAHLNEGELSKGFDCSMCHIVPQFFGDAGHVDSDLPAEIHFGDLATDHGEVSPLWDGVSTCSDVYCHGEFPLGNQDNDPQWTLVGAGQAACGTCHGLPPEGQHPTMDKCYICHASVVDQDNTIIDKEKHINGNTDF